MKVLTASAASLKPAGMGWAFGASVAAHGVALAVIVWGWGSASLPQGVPVMDVELVVAAATEPGGRAPEPGAVPAPGVETPSATAQPPEPVPPAPEPARTPAEKAATADLAIVLPAPQPPPAVQSQDWRDQPAPPLASASPEPAPPPVPASPPQTSGPRQPAPAAPPPSVVPPRPATPTASAQAPAQPTTASTRATAPSRPAAPTASTQAPPQPTSTSAPSTAPPRAAAPSVSSQPPRSPTSAPVSGQGPTTDPAPSGAGVTSGTAQLVRHVAPVYPAPARERGQEGRVVVRLVVGADGVPAEIRIADSSGVAALDAAALEAVRQWRFAPARRAGVAVPEERLAPVVFRLRH
jgi:protein TonB